MATIFRPAGPTYIQIGTGAAGALQHLGWSENGVEIEILRHEEDVKCDYGGPAMPTDVQYFGSEALITVDLNKYDESILSKALAMVRGGTEGNINPADVGSLMLAQGYTHRLLIVAPYQGIAAFSDQQSAYNFPSAYLLPYRTTLSTKVKKFRLQWRAIVQLNWSGTSVSGVLYNNNTTGFATVN